MVVQVTGTDPDGDALARPASWDPENGPPPLILMHPEPPGRPALAPGERVLARLKPVGAGRYEGRTMRRLADAPSRILGVFRHGHGENRLVPTDRRAKAEWIIPPGNDGGAEPGEIVLAEPLPHHHRLGLKPARVIERLGNMGDARSVSLIAIHTHDIPVAFPDAALAEAERAGAMPLGRRTDLRDIPLVTIDGEDARDFDDAVFAEPDDSLVAGRLPADRRDRRRRALRAARIGAGPRGAASRQRGLFPRPRRADAARGAVQRLVQPASRRRPRLPVRRAADRCWRAQAGAPFRPRADAQRRADDLH